MRGPSLVAIIAGLLLTAGLPSPPAIAQEVAPGPTLTVQGKGTVSLEPDRAVIRLGTSDQGDTPGEAQRDVNRVIARAIEIFKQMDVAGLELQTASVSLSPVYDPKPKRGDAPEIIGYRASNALSIRIDDMTKIGTVIDTGIDAGLRELHGITFTLRREETARLDALRNAAIEAKQKARVIADAMDVKLGGLESIVEGGATVTPYTSRFRLDSGMAASRDLWDAPSATPVEGGKIEVRASLTLVYRIREDR